MLGIGAMWRWFLCVLTVGECGSGRIFNGPSSPAERAAWWKSLQDDKASTLEKIGFQGGVFNVSELSWTRTSYMQPQMHPYDLFFYDPVKHEYTVQRYLDDLDARYGGIDAVLIWPTYTNIGVDDRNQWDYFRSLPGGLDAVRNVTQELKNKGVRVLWPYNPWDTGTRREGRPDEEVWPSILEETLGDGFNGDTMTSIPESFWKASVKAKYPLAFEAEEPDDDRIMNWDTIGWGYWEYPKIPVVDRYKFITSGQWMTNVYHRWMKRKVDNLQMAYFNGVGYETWENVWGTWNGITPRDGEAIRRVGTIERYFGKLGYLSSSLWEPHALGMVHAEDVFASKWPSPTSDSTLWTIVNRGSKNFTGPQLSVENTSGRRFYDCYHGVELKPVLAPKGYSMFASSSSSSGAGGASMEIAEAAASRVTVSDCVALCDADDTCSCVTFREADGICWKHSSCQPALFATSADLAEHTVYMKAKGYSAYEGFTINGGSGMDLDDEAKLLESMTATACQAACDDDAVCKCVAYNPSSHKCWKSARCQSSVFEKSEGFTVFVNEARRQSVYLSFDMDVEGYGCVVDMPSAAHGEFARFLRTMKNLTKVSLLSFSAEWTYLPQTMVSIPSVEPSASPPPGMVFVPGGTFEFVTTGVEIEGDDDHGVDVQYPWESHPQKEHRKTMEVASFFMDKFPITTTNYSMYLKATGYRPADPYNWLKNWRDEVEPPSDVAQKPVTYISLEEARAYCRWAHGGSRLPHSWEWQYAAQGGDEHRLYPWGNTKDESKMPQFHTGNTFPGPDDVTAHSPAGDSPFGISDLVGNVWQYTDEFRDAHTRAVILRGGSNYRPAGSSWYFPQALELNTHEKYFLMDDRYERAGTIGFRCVKDAAPTVETVIV